MIYKANGSSGLSVGEIKRALPGPPGRIGREIIFFESVVSTNTLAMDLASKGCDEGTVVIADHQTGGKGRLGRVWVSPPHKNLYMSIVLRPVISPGDAAVLTLMSAVACAAAIKKISSIPVAIKWPNDLMASGRKLGGILTEIKAGMDGISYAVAGIGINVNLDMTELPDVIGGTATSMYHETGMFRSRTEVAVEILRELDVRYEAFLTSGKGWIIDECARLSSTIGRIVRIDEGAAGAFTGLAEGLDGDGMLLVRTQDNTLRRISAGDVSYPRDYVPQDEGRALCREL